MTAPTLTIEDIVAAARAVAAAGAQGIPVEEALAGLLEAQRQAETHVRAYGRPHHALGDGSLAAAARHYRPVTTPSWRDMLAAAACVCEVLSRTPPWSEPTAPREQADCSHDSRGNGHRL